MTSIPPEGERKAGRLRSRIEQAAALEQAEAVLSDPNLAPDRAPLQDCQKAS